MLATSIKINNINPIKINILKQKTKNKEKKRKLALQLINRYLKIRINLMRKGNFFI